jgi:hypothetical protein
MMHDKAMRSLSALCLSLVCGAAFAACAGSDTPPTDEALEASIATAYANGSGPTGGTGGSAGRGGAAGRGGTGGGSSNGGSAQTAGTGGGEPAGGAAGAGMSTGGTAGEDPPPGGCEGFAILQENCNGPSCHGTGAPYANFAGTEEEALAFVGESGTTTCSAEGPLLDPENPKQSIIVQKVNGTVPCGGAMPIGGELTEDEIACLEEWIATL